MAGAATITEFPLPTGSGAPLAITAGPDGALWFTESEANKIGRITTATPPPPSHDSDPNSVGDGQPGWPVGRADGDGSASAMSFESTDCTPVTRTNRQ